MAESGKSDGDLGTALERMERKLQDVEAAQGRAKMAGRIMTVLIAVTALCMVWFVFAKPLLELWGNKEKHANEAITRAQERLTPVVRKEAESLVKDVVPILEKAASDSRDTHLPKIMQAVEKESKQLVSDLVLYADTQSTEFLHSFQEEQVAKLKEAFPKLKDEAKATEINERLGRVCNNVARRLSEDLLKEHFDAIAHMSASFDRLDVPEDVAKMSQSELDEHVAALLLELVKIKLSDAESKPLAVEGGANASS